MSQPEYELVSPPTDGVSRVRFAPSENTLLVSSWDTTVRLYDVMRNTMRAKYNHKAAVLDCCFSDDTHSISGGIDRAVKVFDIPTSTETIVGEHDEAVRCVEWSKQENLLVTGSWDATIKLWDLRSRSPTCIGTYRQPERVYSMDVTSNNKVIVGTAGRHIWVWDLRRMAEPEQRRESSLKYQTRCVKAFPDGTGFALSSIEARVAVEYFDPAPEVQAQKYAFKCHRHKNAEGIDIAYPVNDIAFHPTFGTFATGGADGMISVWDGRNKKRLCQFHKYPTSIASLDFNHDGSILAIASSYTHEEGDKPHPNDTIFIRTNTEEFRPKPRV